MRASAAAGLRRNPGWVVGLAVLLACHGGSGGDPSATGDVAVGLQEVAAGLDFPLDLKSPPGDTRRLFVAEKGGRVRIIEDGSLLETPFLDLRGEVSGGGEQGLLGIAFHPDYASNGRFVVDYTDSAGDSQVVAYRVSADPGVADSDSAESILTVGQPFANHNGGGLVFGPDGFLYIGLGDGGSSGDPQGNGQDLGDLLGSLLRIDIDGGSPYVIPPDNPFAGTAGSRAEIWNYGLRNPWRFSFDRGTGDLYIGDVGQDSREEIDVAPASTGGGENYGWNLMEGSRCFGAEGCDQSGLSLPVLDYGHDDGCSVTGGFVYRGSAIPALRGRYFYADFCSGWVRSFRYGGAQATERREWPTLAPGGMITSFGEDANGELYILVASGKVYRIVPG